MPNTVSRALVVGPDDADQYEVSLRKFSTVMRANGRPSTLFMAIRWATHCLASTILIFCRARQTRWKMNKTKAKQGISAPASIMFEGRMRTVSDQGFRCLIHAI